jgi:hypothetical protein
MSARLRIAAPIALAIALAPAAASAQMPPPPQLSHAEGEGPHIDAYAGMEFVTLTRGQFESFEVRGLSRQPYVLKVADVHLTGLGRFEAGINGAATSALALGGFTSEDKTSRADIGDAERYAALLGYAIGKNVTLRGEGTFAHMVTYAAPSFHRTGDIPLTTYFVPQNGAPTRLLPGDSVPGNTDWYSLSITARFDGNPLGGDWLKDIIVGYRLIRVSTLSSYLASQGQYVDSVLQGIVQDTFTCHSVYALSNVDKALWSDLHLVGHAHVFGGYASVSSAFADTAGGICFGQGGTISLQYVQPHWSFVIGYNYDEFVGVTFGGNSVSQTFAYSDPRTGRVSSAQAGSSWNINGPAESFRVLGPFARITVAY